MNVYAKIIVDVPTGGTDRPFDYYLPEELARAAERGMRVLVPFGQRKLTGFIVDIVSETSVEKVKNVSELLDIKPVLNEELLRLGAWLAKETICFQITALQAMIPAAMRTKAVKKLAVTSEREQLPMNVQALFGQAHELAWAKVPKDARILRDIRTAIAQRQVTERFEVKGQAAPKKVKAVMLLSREGNTPDTTKQQETLAYLAEHYGPSPVAVQTLMQQADVSRSVVHTLVKRGFLQETELVIDRNPYTAVEGDGSEEKATLTADQSHVLTQVEEKMAHSQATPMLLHGVTGSGKTEIYLQAIDQVIREGQEAIVLVPEISLTPQMVGRFKRRFGANVAVLHSALSVGERFDEWKKIQEQNVQVAVGARSAVFAPFTNLGLIVIDEEHESTYKQEEHPRYHAREVALWRSEYHSCPVLMGSATPSMESYARAAKGVYRLLSLPERINEKPLPAIEVADMRKEMREGNRSVFSTSLLDKLRDRIEKEEQAVLFLNRRGFSTFVMCRNCGYVGMCPHCEISLTYHRRDRQLKCHYCGHEEGVYERCPACESEHIRYFGTGTQRVEEELQQLLPEARIIRMDNDTTRQKGAHERLLKQFGRGEAEILLGTQMIAKGLDFPNITLAGVLAADTLLHLPDFRAQERTFQLLTQVSGRAGRDEKAGEVIIQSYTPEHYAIELARAHDYLSFFKKELGQRKQAGYPPYFYLTLITFAHPTFETAMKAGKHAAAVLRTRLGDDAIVLGPTPSPIARIKDRYRCQCMIKYKDEPALTDLLHDLFTYYQKELQQDQRFMTIDRNPSMFM
ncbi:primosomal protein N' [Natribacillus halophilus]|uniref:Replication restart protein PriA n=1 Tax=Natribacillus halophilus TaxID=549003 RepID=A0A1G8MHP4_9BACI|nr:primosomal protein N' [Natribacillus halophilus]SDI67426.1 replication restart DNA helicase PriA [Natribacillus halophilus]